MKKTTTKIFLLIATISIVALIAYLFYVLCNPEASYESKTAIGNFLVTSYVLFLYPGLIAGTIPAIVSVCLYWGSMSPKKANQKPTNAPLIWAIISFITILAVSSYFISGIATTASMNNPQDPFRILVVVLSATYIVTMLPVMISRKPAK